MVHFSNDQTQDSYVMMDNTVSFEKLISNNHQYTSFYG